MSILTTIQKDINSQTSSSTFNIHLLRDTDEIDQLKEAILLAIDKDEDVLLFSKTSKNIPKISFEDVNDLILDLASNGIQLILIDVDSDVSVQFNKKLAYLDEIKAIHSFFITRPLYHIVLALIEQREEYECYTLEKLNEIVNPYNIKLASNPDFLLKEQKVNIISPFRNAAAYLKDYLDSVENQSYKNYNTFLIDDASTDHYNITDRLNSKIHLKKNTTRQFALQNIVDNLISTHYEDDDVICLVDADDILLHNYVLDIINATYKNNMNTTLTYGSMVYLNHQFRITKFGSKYSKEEFENLRASTWRVAHIRSFKYKLFKELIIQDPTFSTLKNEKGEIFKMPSDMALLFPLMEIAGYNAVQFINIPLHGYRIHENNDQNKYRKLQYQGELAIRAKPSLKTTYL